MNSFSLCTATREKDYFIIPPSDPARKVFVLRDELDPALDKREKVWRSTVSSDLSFALVSRGGEVTFFAGPLKTDRKDRLSRPIVNYVIKRSTDPDDKRRMGRIFAAMLANTEARDKFAERIETEIVQPVLKGEGTWDGRLPEMADAPDASDLPAEAIRRVYPAADSVEAARWAGQISALLERNRDFAVGLSVRSGDTVARELQQIYSFDWRSTFIAVFSEQAESPAPLSCPMPVKMQQGPKKNSGIPWVPIGFIVLAVFVLVVGISTCGRHEEKTPPPPYGGDVSRPVPGSQTGK